MGLQSVVMACDGAGGLSPPVLVKRLTTGRSPDDSPPVRNRRWAFRGSVVTRVRESVARWLGTWDARSDLYAS